MNNNHVRLTVKMLEDSDKQSGGLCQIDCELKFECLNALWSDWEASGKFGSPIRVIK